MTGNRKFQRLTLISDSCLSADVKEELMETSKSVVGPSLPPLVDGQIRCFLHLSLGKVKWNLSKRPQNIQVRVQWWGQQTNGILLRLPHNFFRIKGRFHDSF